MEPTPELIRQLDEDRWNAASSMTFEQRAVAGVSLFDLMAESMRVGIRIEHPNADRERVDELLIGRLREARSCT